MRKIKLIHLLSAVSALIISVALLSVPRDGVSAKETEKKSLTVKGSDTMVHLASSWAEAFMKSHPAIEVSVTGGGSGTGIAALINGTTDVCNASRSMKQEEIDQAKQKGVMPYEITVARDGISIVVNPANTLKNVTMEQLEKIYTGVYTNWKELGGPDREIVVLSRESSSGTYVFFQEHVMKKKDYTARARLLPATSAIIQSVTEDKGAIGYVGLGYAEEAKNKVKTLGVKANEGAPAVMPSEKTIKSGEYPVARPLFMYTNGQPGGTVKVYVDFCLSAEGQKIVVDEGYITK